MAITDQQLTHQHGYTTTAEATAIVAGGLFVGFNGAKCGDGAKALGVNLFDVAVGEDMSVIVDRKVEIEVSANVTVLGTPMTSDANGKAKPAEEGDAVNGYACTLASSGGKIVLLLA